MGVGIKQCCLADPSLLITKGLIGAEWVGSDDGSTFQVENPATREVIAELPKLGSSETERAIVAAEKAFSVWKKKTAKERSSIMKRWLDLVKENVEDLAKIITLENGKPLAEAMGEMAFATDIIEFYAEEAKRIEGDVSSSIFAEKKILVLRQVCPALAAGCTMVLKPAELTPFSALALAELGLRAGFPPGVLNIVMGDAPAVGKALKDSPAVRKMAFTGSTAVGRTIMEGCAKTLKRVSLELGGNAPFIVFDDADVDLAVQGLIAAKFWNNGQVCISPNRVLVHDGVYDTFSKKLAEAVGALKVGNGFDKEVTTGPVITVQGMQKVFARNGC
ncbi:hypothetical protein CBR_g12541 [Chara braunii]|uniref:Aldehyde dehydrogenase domain-containing protein n=1 Tax=Chara braunii TaxID=69332 RepID=A0A388JSR8_CHABU|nr:hypothetical protein CBR_g12541 [Chara braunii]|eukprot:GBG60803.1 hypothetical protein CBR_g12541 [Chara braunii]